MRKFAFVLAAIAATAFSVSSAQAYRPPHHHHHLSYHRTWRVMDHKTVETGVQID
jgi:hypothetical protein